MESGPSSDQRKQESKTLLHTEKSFLSSFEEKRTQKILIKIEKNDQSVDGKKIDQIYTLEFLKIKPF